MTNPLAELKDIQLPDPIGFWPIAWGWWLMLIVSITLMIVAIVWWRKNRYRFYAKKKLVQHYKDYQTSLSALNYVQQLVTLLRQTAVTAYGVESVSQLQGKQWSVFLNSKTKQPIFDEQHNLYITQAPFCDVHYFETHFSNISIPQLHELALQWIRQHR